MLLLTSPAWFRGTFFFLQNQTSRVAYLGSNTELQFIKNQYQELGLSCALKREPRGFAFLFSDASWQERLFDVFPIIHYMGIS